MLFDLYPTADWPTPRPFSSNHENGAQESIEKADEAAMTDPAQACGTDMFALFLLENGWASMGYTLSYHPKWLRETTFPCYERVGGVWRMKAEVEREIDEWLAECKRRRKAIATWTRK